jgi:N-acetyl-gamma-glutamyl-phosphate reductase
MKYKVFVDGREGTTGLEIEDYLLKRNDIELLKISDEKRKDPEARGDLLNASDISFLCLPDVAARESVELVTNPNTRVIDASTAHRTNPEWAYGLPELNKLQRNLIAASKRVCVPGCHATACILALYPLISGGILPKDYPVVCCSVTGHSGGGKKLIQMYQQGTPDLNTPKYYALGLNHKHLPEIQAVTGLSNTPTLIPIVANYYRGMAVSTPLSPRLFNKRMTAKELHNYFSEYYASEHFIQVAPFSPDSYPANGYFDAEGCNFTNRADIFVYGNDELIQVMVRLDNLGKGASGAAVQCMNLMLGTDESIGLSI